MIKPLVLSRAASGAFVTFASMFNVACAPMYVVQPMHSVDLDNFQIDCRIKEQQIRMLQSMRSNPDTRFVNRLEQAINPLGSFTDYDAAYQRQEIGRGRTDWLINQHLMTLRNNCGPSQ